MIYEHIILLVLYKFNLKSKLQIVPKNLKSFLQLSFLEIYCNSKMKQPINKVSKSQKVHIPSKFLTNMKVHVNEDEVDHAMEEFEQKKALITKLIPCKRARFDNYNQFSVFHKLAAVYFATHIHWNATAKATSEFLSQNPLISQKVLRKWVNNTFIQQLLRILSEKYGSSHLLKLIPGFDGEGEPLKWITNSHFIAFHEIDKSVMKAYGFTYPQSRVRKTDEFINHIISIGKIINYISS